MSRVESMPMKKPTLCGLFVLVTALILARLLGAVDEAAAQPLPQRIGVLTPGLTFEPALQGLREGLERLGLRPDKELSFTVQDTKGAGAELAEPAKKVLESAPHVLFAVTTAHAVAAKQLAGELPIVFVWVSDPVKSGLITGYGNSKSNVTGIMSYAVPLSGKRLEILKELAPAAKRILALVAPKEAISLESFKLVEQSAEKLRLEIVRREVSTKEDIEKVLAALPRGAIDAIYHVPSILVSSQVELLIKRSKEEKLPLMAHEAAMAERGALFTFGADFHQSGVQAARLVAKILKGSKPSEIPAETPDKLMLVVNRATAKLMGAKISREAITRADRIVE